MSVSGFLNVNKPEGKNSFAVIVWMRKLLGEKRVGHGGTLDPIASGVLPVSIGQATKITQFVTDHDKIYSAEILLGTATDTFDSTGTVVFRGDAGNVSRDKIVEALASFQGSIEQIPPIYSAIKFRGKHYYQLARKGIEVKPVPRTVFIKRCDLIAYEPPRLTVELECGKGTYVRSVANDLGKILGCGGHLTKLVRTRCGIFKIEDSLSLEQIEEIFKNGSLQQYLYPVDSGLPDFKKVYLNEEESRLIFNGGFVDLDGNISPGDRVSAYNHENKLLAILDFHKTYHRWHAQIGFRL